MGRDFGINEKITNGVQSHFQLKSIALHSKK